MKTHVSLNVSDVRASVEFYKKMFGIEPFKIRADYAKFDITNPPLNLTMNQTNFKKDGALSHLGLQVETTGEVLEIGKRWIENGLKTSNEMNIDCCYALQDKTWVTDPDGNRWEVFTVMENTDEVKSDSLCCVPNEKTVGITRL